MRFSVGTKRLRKRGDFLFRLGIKTLVLGLFLALSINSTVMAELPQMTNDAVFTIGNNEVMVDGSKYALDVAPFVANGRTYLPIRYLGETLGATVSYIDGSAVLKFPQKTLLMKNNMLFMSNEGKYELMDVTPVIDSNRIFLPARYVCDAAGYETIWMPQDRAMVVKRKIQ